MGQDNRLTDAESQAVATVFGISLTRFVDLIKAIENMSQSIRWNSDACIADGQFNARPISRSLQLNLMALYTRLVSNCRS